MPADFVKKALINADIKEKDLELYKEVHTQLSPRAA
jgi:hypothetical protein